MTSLLSCCHGKSGGIEKESCVEPHSFRYGYIYSYRNVPVFGQPFLANFAEHESRAQKEESREWRLESGEWKVESTSNTKRQRSIKNKSVAVRLTSFAT